MLVLLGTTVDLEQRKGEKKHKHMFILTICHEIYKGKYIVVRENHRIDINTGTYSTLYCDYILCCDDMQLTCKCRAFNDFSDPFFFLWFKKDDYTTCILNKK